MYKFEVKKAVNGEFFVVIKAGNRETTWSTETFKEERTAHKAIASLFRGLGIPGEPVYTRKSLKPKKAAGQPTR